MVSRGIMHTPDVGSKIFFNAVPIRTSKGVFLGSNLHDLNHGLMLRRLANRANLIACQVTAGKH